MIILEVMLGFIFGAILGVLSGLLFFNWWKK